MKAYKQLLLASLMVGGAMSQAQERAVQTLKPSKYDALKAGDLNPGTLFYSQKIKSFSDWNEADPDESQVLVLFPNYEEPTVAYIKEGERREIQEKLIMYVVRTKTVLQKPAAQINLAKMITMPSIESLDKTIMHREIGAGELMQNVVGKKAINNFAWCNKGGDYILRPQKEIDMSHLAGHNWCSTPGKSKCLESCYIFTDTWKKGVGLATSVLDAGAVVTGKEVDRKDLGIAMQSEMRFYNSEAEYGAQVPLSQLTHINTPVRGIVEQNIFYFNQIFQYGKIVSILQDKEGDANQTVMSNFIVVGIRERSWNKYEKYGLVDVLKGVSVFNSKPGTGLTAGIPDFTQNMSKAIAKSLEQ